MTLLFMRAVHTAGPEAERLAPVSRMLAEVFPDILVISVGGAAYEVSDAAFISSGCEVKHFQTMCYDPRHLFGSEKVAWIFDEWSPRVGISSLRAFSRRLISEFLDILTEFPERPLLFYCDALIIEIFMLEVRQADISELKHFSLILDILSLTVVGRRVTNRGMQFSLICYNRSIEDVLVNTPMLRLVQ